MSTLISQFKLKRLSTLRRIALTKETHQTRPVIKQSQSPNLRMTPKIKTPLKTRQIPILLLKMRQMMMIPTTENPKVTDIKEMLTHSPIPIMKIIRTPITMEVIIMITITLTMTIIHMTLTTMKMMIMNTTMRRTTPMAMGKMIMMIIATITIHMVTITTWNLRMPIMLATLMTMKKKNKRVFGRHSVIGLDDDKFYNN